MFHFGGPQSPKENLSHQFGKENGEYKDLDVDDCHAEIRKKNQNRKERKKNLY